MNWRKSIDISCRFLVGMAFVLRLNPFYRKVKRDPKVTQLKRRKRQLEEFTGTFQPDQPTFIVVHGWKSSTQSDTVQNIKNNYLSTQECNVIGIWFGISKILRWFKFFGNIDLQPSIGRIWHRIIFTWYQLDKHAKLVNIWPKWSIILFRNKMLTLKAFIWLATVWALIPLAMRAPIREVAESPVSQVPFQFQQLKIQI